MLPEYTPVVRELNHRLLTTMAFPPLSCASNPRCCRMASQKRDRKRDLYYVFPVSGKALKRRYYRLMLSGIVTGVLVGGLLALALWLANRH